MAMIKATGKLEKIAEININKLDDRKAVAGILLENGYTIGPGKRNRTKTGKQVDYFLKVYKEAEDDSSDTI